MSETIMNIIRLINDPNCARMNLSNLKGYLGELIVLDQLREEGVIGIHKGNQSGYDIEIPNRAKIDVKFSTFKPEFHDWGWALVPYSKRRDISCSHFVCVAINEDYSINAYYVINAIDIHAFPSSVGRFILKHSFSVIKEGCSYPDAEYFSICTDLIKHGIVKKVLPRGKLTDVL